MERCNEIRVPSEEAVQLVEYCIQNGYKISTAESCTGGLIAAGIVDVPGASNVFEEGYVTYADRVKQKLLHVSVTTIQKYTVVSAQVAEEMALGTAQASGADISVTTTGYAGPEDGEDGTPAGTVYIGTCFRGCAESRKYCFDGDRGQVRLQAAREAMKFALESERALSFGYRGGHPSGSFYQSGRGSQGNRKFTAGYQYRLCQRIVENLQFNAYRYTSCARSCRYEVEFFILPARLGRRTLYRCGSLLFGPESSGIRIPSGNYPGRTQTERQYGRVCGQTNVEVYDPERTMYQGI